MVCIMSRFSLLYALSCTLVLSASTQAQDMNFMSDDMYYIRQCLIAQLNIDSPLVNAATGLPIREMTWVSVTMSLDRFYTHIDFYTSSDAAEPGKPLTGPRFNCWLDNNTNRITSVYYQTTAGREVEKVITPLGMSKEQLENLSTDVIVNGYNVGNIAEAIKVQAARPADTGI